MIWLGYIWMIIFLLWAAESWRHPHGYVTWLLEGAWLITGIIFLSWRSIADHDVFAAVLVVFCAWLIRNWWKKRPPRQRKGAGALLGAKSRAMREAVLRKMREAGDGLRRPVPVLA